MAFHWAMVSGFVSPVMLLNGMAHEAVLDVAAHVKLGVTDVGAGAKGPLRPTPISDMKTPADWYVYAPPLKDEKL
jgi:hypothetical protein